jgi:hypothetical protein
MALSRRKFLQIFTYGGLLLLGPIKALSENAWDTIQFTYKDALRRITEIITTLKKEGSSIVKKTLNEKKYSRDPAVHYPYEDSIEDPQTHCQVFFHAHRKNEYGHFHTFIDNENGELVHLIMISMDKKGLPVALSTLNRWVTGDYYVDAAELKKLALQFQMSHDLFPDKRIIEFIENIFTGYRDIIFQLFDERDKAISEYVEENAQEPFEDNGVEILSKKTIDVYKDVF